MADLIRSRNEAQDKAGELLQHAWLHDLRHFTPQSCCWLGRRSVWTRPGLGHTDPSITLRVYAHVIREQVAEAADIFARSIPPAGSAAVSKSVSKKVATKRAKGR